MAWTYIWTTVDFPFGSGVFDPDRYELVEKKDWKKKQLEKEIKFKEEFLSVKQEVVKELTDNIESLKKQLKELNP